MKETNYYLKANKDNKVVILDKVDYYERVNALLAHGLYVNCLWYPVLKILFDVDIIFKKCNNVVSRRTFENLSILEDTFL